MSSSFNRRVAQSGQVLKETIYKTASERTAIIDGFLYENSVLMVSADPACGKSTVVACAMAQMSAGLPVFGQLAVPRPIRSYYIPFERGIEEIAERFQQIEKVIKINWDNIAINEQFIGYNVTNDRHADEIVFNIRKDCAEWGGRPDVIILDPIYAAVSGGLSTDEKASQFCRFSARLIKEFKCANWLNHHTVKTSYDSEGKAVLKDDPFYGSQWLKAHCTAAYYMKRDESIDGVLMLNKKDSHGNLLAKIPLGYDAETYTSYIKGMAVAMETKDRAYLFVRACRKQNKSFTFKEFQHSIGAKSVSYARTILSDSILSVALQKLSAPGQPTLYLPIADV